MYENKGMLKLAESKRCTLFASVANKGFPEACCWRESNGGRWEEFGELRGTTWRASILRRAPSSGGQAEKSCRLNNAIMPYRYLLSSGYYKWLLPRRLREGGPGLPENSGPLVELAPGGGGEEKAPRSKTEDGVPRMVLVSVARATRPTCWPARKPDLQPCSRIVVLILAYSLSRSSSGVCQTIWFL